MEPEVNITPDKRSTSSEYYRRLKSSRNSMPCLVNMDDTTELKKQKTSINVLHYSSPSAISPLLDHSEDKKFGSVTKEIQALRAQRMQVMSPYFAKYPSLLDRFDEVGMINKEETGRLENQRVTGLPNQGVITNDPEEEHITNDVSVIVLSSEEDDRDEKPSGPFQEAVLKQSVEQLPMRDTVEYCRRIKSSRNSMPCLVNMDDTIELQKQKTSINVLHYSSPSAISPLLDHSDDKKFGSVTKEIQVLLALRMQVLSPYFAKYPSLLDRFGEVGMINKEETGKLENQRVTGLTNQGVITNDLEEEDITNDVPAAASLPDVIILSNEEDDSDEKPSVPFQEAVLKHFVEQLPMRDTVEYHDPNASKAEFEAPKSEPSPAGKDITSKDKSVYVGVEGQHCYEEYHVPIAYHEECETPKSEGSSAGKDNTSRDKGVYVGVQEEDMHEVNTEDGLEDIWREMSMAIECSKDVAVDPPPDEEVNKGGEYCDHSFILKDDLGYVCRVCGIIDRGIETIFEFQYKIKRSTRTYMPDTWNSKDRAVREVSGLKFVEDCVVVSGISAHPRHMNQMKPHQVEGFNFLVSNLVGENPGGCILAHAPGSGKTFMIISFMQSFLAKYPNARPLVVLPKGILATWKKEFKTWQVEDLPLLDFYSAKADNRSQQLEVLQKWVEQKSILFLGYKQLSTIVCDCGTSSNNDTSSKCQEILLKVPSILILDEGHTARNEDTNVLQSLAKVKTPRKVVLSGTLYQNHVAEVFNILNLVRPRFLRLETSRPFVKRIMSRVNIQGVRKQLKASGHGAFYDLVENTLQQETDFKSKVAVIQDLREMTSKVLHFYKGDFLDELPGLVDFSVLLNLSSRQKHETEKLKMIASKFKMSSIGSAVYLHPSLKALSEKCTDISSVTDCMVDEMLEGLVVKDGVKAKFFLNMLNLCESSGEKLLVFSQYLLPLKFLERLAVKKRGWSPGNEIFVISGESSPEQREWSMERFNNSPDAKVFFGSIKACGEGISLVGASRIIVLDVHLNPSVTRQAIGRAFRPGQVKRVFAYRLVAADSPEAEDHNTCFKKELISRMWFEWNEYCGYQNFEFKTVDVKKCGDVFLESPILGEDVKVLYESLEGGS